MPVFLRKKYPRGTKRWVAQIELGADPATGKRRYRQTYHLTKDDATEAEAKLRADRAGGKLRAIPSSTMAEYLELWLRQTARQVEPKTLEQYRHFAESVLTPAMGSKRLGRVTRADAQLMVTAFAEGGRSAKWLRNLVGVARKAMNDAIDLELVTTNPFTRLKLPKVRQRTLTVWSPDQVRPRRSPG